MGCVAEQNQAAGEPAPTVDPADGIQQQVVEDDTLSIGPLRREVPVATPGGRLQGRVEIPHQQPQPRGLQP